MSLHWLQCFRPKHRWFQYRLRTLFVLMTLVCIWLSYNAWRYEREQVIVAGIIARDPQAVIVWAGPSWLKWLDKDCVPTIFRRVREVTFHSKARVSAEISEEVLQLRLQKLSALKRLTWYWEDDFPKSNNLDELLPGIELVRGIYFVTVISDDFGDDDLKTSKGRELIDDHPKAPAGTTHKAPVKAGSP